MLITPIDNSTKARLILESNKRSDDLKLFEVFEIYKDELSRNYTQLYYALLGWKDKHLKELQAEQSKLK